MKKQINLKVKEVFKNENKEEQEKAVQTILNKLIKKVCVSFDTFK